MTVSHVNVGGCDCCSRFCGVSPGFFSVSAHNMSLSCERTKLLFLEMVNSEGICCNHYHHWDVEREEGAEDEKMLVVHLTYIFICHQVTDIKQGEDRYR